MAINQHNSVILVLLDLSAAFDTVDHDILMSNRFGITGTVLVQNGFDHIFLIVHSLSRVIVRALLLMSLSLVYRRDPFLVRCYIQAMYTSPLGEIAQRHQMFYHFYADDTQLCITFRTSSVSDMNLSNAKLGNCGLEMDAWMLSNKLKLNKDKSEVLVISSSYRPRPPLSSVDICDETVSCSPSARSIGVIFDESLCIASTSCQCSLSIVLFPSS